MECVKERLHPAAVAERMRVYLALVRAKHKGLQISVLSERLGYTDSGVLDRLFEGERYHTWSELEEFCWRTGTSEEWIKHGIGSPFKVNGEFMVEGVGKVKQQKGDWRLYIARSDCREGKVCFVLRRSEMAWEVFWCRAHIRAPKSDWWVSDRDDLVLFYQTVCQLYDEWKLRVWSGTLEEEVFDSLEAGLIFPGGVVDGFGRDLWADDFVDVYSSDELSRKQREGRGAEFMGAWEAVRRAVL